MDEMVEDRAAYELVFAVCRDKADIPAPFRMASRVTSCRESRAVSLLAGLLYSVG